MESASPRRQTLSQLLRQNRDRVLAEWEQAVRAAPSAVALRPEALRASVPGLLDGILATVEGRSQPPTEETPEHLAVARMEQGLSVQQVAWEHAALRSALFRLLDQGEVSLEAGALTALNEAVDAAIARAVAAYHRAGSRRLEALDRVSQQALADPQTLDDLLHRLLGCIVETTPPVDTAAIYLREWDQLVLRAAVGLPPEIEGGYRLARGEGFAGAVAARKQPLFTSSAATDPLVNCAVLRKLGVRALYGAPLIRSGKVIGVAKMGSRTVDDFSDEDRGLFGVLAERAAALIEQRRATEERDLLLGILGHDLRAPLSTIVLGAEAIHRSGGLPQSASRLVPRMASAARRMDRMINDLTDFTKARAAGGLPMERRALDLHDCVTRIVGELRALNPDRQLRLELTGDTAGEWDAGRIAQLVTNLVNNALAYGNRSSPVTVTVEADERSVTLCVNDEGEPIAPELLPQVFDPLKRGKKGTGLGLGLYTVQQIARAHGGRAEVDSTRERGTTFRVRLTRWSNGPGSPVP